MNSLTLDGGIEHGVSKLGRRKSRHGRIVEQNISLQTMNGIRPHFQSLRALELGNDRKRIAAGSRTGRPQITIAGQDGPRIISKDVKANQIAEGIGSVAGIQKAAV